MIPHGPAGDSPCYQSAIKSRAWGSQGQGGRRFRGAHTWQRLHADAQRQPSSPRTGAQKQRMSNPQRVFTKVPIPIQLMRKKLHLCILVYKQEHESEHDTSTPNHIVFLEVLKTAIQKYYKKPLKSGINAHWRKEEMLSNQKLYSVTFHILPPYYFFFLRKHCSHPLL